MPRQYAASDHGIQCRKPSDCDTVTPECEILCTICRAKLHRDDSRRLRRCSIHWHTIPHKARAKGAYRAKDTAILDAALKGKA